VIGGATLVCSNQGTCNAQAQCKTCSCDNRSSGAACQCSGLRNAFVGQSILTQNAVAHYAFNGAGCTVGDQSPAAQAIRVITAWLLIDGNAGLIANYRRTSPETTFWNLAYDGTSIILSATNMDGSYIPAATISVPPSSPARWVHMKLLWGLPGVAGNGRPAQFIIWDTTAGEEGTGAYSSAVGGGFCGFQHTPLDATGTFLTIGSAGGGAGGVGGGVPLADFQIWSVFAGDESGFSDSVYNNQVAIIDSFKDTQIPRVLHTNVGLPRPNAHPFMSTNDATTKAMTLTSHIALVPEFSAGLPVTKDYVGKLLQSEIANDGGALFWIDPTNIKPQNPKCLNDCSGKGECCDGVCSCASGFQSAEDCSVADPGSLVATPAAQAQPAMDTPATVGSILGGVAGFAILALVFARVAKTRLSHALLAEEQPNADGISASAAASSTGFQSLA
jgi:hypothetical protein